MTEPTDPAAAGAAPRPGRLRAAQDSVEGAARAAGRLLRRRSGPDESVIGDVDDLDDGEVIPPPDVPPEDLAELAALDEADDDDDDAELGLDHLGALLRELDPPVPDGMPFTTGLAALLRRWADAEGPSSFPGEARVLRVVGLLGDRYGFAVTHEGITVRGLVRRRHVPWQAVRGITFVPRYVLLREHVLERGIANAATRSVPVPVPGARWVVRKIVLALERRLPEDERRALAEHGGIALQAISRRGLDIELTGAMALVAFLSDGLTAAVAAEAHLRGIPVDGAPEDGAEGDG
jgi:hypothetical protein